MGVKLLATTERPISVLWTAARTCKVEEYPSKLFEAPLQTSKMLEVLKRIWDAGHLSVFEHVNFTYALEDVSRVCLAELTRHRIGITFSVKGQRMILNKMGAWIPDEICSLNLKKQYQEMLRVGTSAYFALLKNGVSAETARYILPQAITCNMVCTINMRELKHLWDVRGNNPAALSEIRELVKMMVKVAKDRHQWINNFITEDGE